jgi:RecA-family ATPase
MVGFKMGEEMNIPKVTQDYLEFGAPEGQRNDSLLAAACQLRDAGYSVDEAEDILIIRGQTDGLTSSEAMRTIVSAFKREPRDPLPGKRNYTLKHRQPVEQSLKIDPIIDAPPKPLPVAIEGGFHKFLEACFNPGEFVSIGCGVETEDGRIVPDSGVTMPREEWGRRMANYKHGVASYNGKLGVYVRLNPMQKEGDSDHHVSKFRHCLVEFDSIPKDQQYGAILESGLPISAIIDSGGKSIHAWVRVDAKDRQEYDQRVAVAFSVFENYNPDRNNKNPSRYSRLPDARRGEGFQRLLAVNVGAASWDDWSIENEKDGLPAIQSAADFLSENIKEPPILISGVLHKGGKMVLGGPSKSRKTWVMCDLAFAVSKGEKWLGIQCQKGNVLYINFELPRFALQKRLVWLENTRDSKDRGNLDFWNLRGHSADLALLVDKICRRVRKKKYDLIIIDPIYKCLGDRDENSAGQITDLLNHVERLAESTDAAIAIATHFPKGNMAAREAMDRIAGSGVFARDPDAVVTMSPHEVKEGDSTVRFDINFNIRNFEEVDSFVVYWDAPVMKKDTIKPRAKGSKGPAPKYEFADMLKFRTDDMDVKEWASKCCDETGISRRSFFRLKKEYESRQTF